MLAGSRFQGISQASGGNSVQDSSTNYPIVQLRRLDNEQVLFLPVDPAQGWSDTSFTSVTLNNFPAGPALVTVFTNGIPSNSKYLLVQYPSFLLNSASSFAYHFSPNPPNPPILIPFEINLPLNGSPGIECRSGDPSDNLHNIFFYFTHQVTATSNATVSCGTVTFRGSNGNPISVEFNGAGCNQQYVTVTLTGMQDSYGQTLPPASVMVGLLLGDTTGNGTVNSSDVAQTKSQSGHPISASNFREDVNVNTVINSSDVGLVKSRVGTSLGSAAGITSTAQTRTGEAGSPR